VWRDEVAPGLSEGNGAFFCEAWNRSSDMLVPAALLAGGSVGVAHVNGYDTPDAVFRKTLERQGIDLSNIPDFLRLNPSRGRVFGAVMSGVEDTAWRRLNSTTIISQRAAGMQRLLITCLTTVEQNEQEGSELFGGWAAAASHLSQQLASGWEAAAVRHNEVWHTLWSRSYVHVSTNTTNTKKANHSKNDPSSPGYYWFENGVLNEPTAVLTYQRYLDLADGRLASYPIGHGGQAWGVQLQGETDRGFRGLT
jgi:hypothetical protein